MFVREVITLAVLPNVRQLAGTYLYAGDLCYIVIVTYHYPAESIAVALSILHLLAVGGKVLNGQSDGTLTDNPLGTATFGAGKVVRVTE